MRRKRRGSKRSQRLKADHAGTQKSADLRIDGAENPGIWGVSWAPLVQLLQPEKAQKPVEAQEEPEINKLRKTEHAGHHKAADLTIGGTGKP